MPFAESFEVSGIIPASTTGTLPNSYIVPCGFLPDKVELVNITSFGTTPNTGFLVIQNLSWYASSPLNNFSYTINTGSTATVPKLITANGISLYNSEQSVTLSGPISGVSISSASPAVVTTSAAHGLSIGDVVQFSGLAEMQPLGGVFFTVSTVPSTTTFTILVNTAVYTAEGAGFSVRKVSTAPLYVPGYNSIVAMTATNPLVISLSEFNVYSVGQVVRIRVPSAYGMQQANNLVSTITAVTANTITLGNVNASSFSAFALPAGGNTWSASSPAQVIPVGSGPIPVPFPTFWSDDTLADSTTNFGVQGFIVGNGILRLATSTIPGIVASDNLIWTATKFDI